MKRNKFIICILVIFSIFTLYGCSPNNNAKISENEIIVYSSSDHEKFAEEYRTVGKDNVFVYCNADQAYKILKDGTGVVLFGFPQCKWCQAYVPILNAVALRAGYENIFYCNILNDRQSNSKIYQKIVDLLGDNLDYDEEGNHRIYVPNVTFVINGKIIGNDYETAKDTKGYDSPEEYWTNEDLQGLETRLDSWFKVVISGNSTLVLNR